MKFPRYIIVAVLVCVLSISIRCSHELAGGSEIGNPATIIGKAVYSNTGCPAPHAKVRLRTKDFTAVAGSVPLNGRSNHYFNTTTDDSGCFLIKGIDSGSYCIEINDDSSMYNSTSSAAVVFCTVSAEDSLISISSVANLKKTGSITGSYVSLPDSSVTIGVLGIDRSAILNTALKSFSISDIPEGAYKLYVAFGSECYLPGGNEPVTVHSTEVSTISSIDLAPMSAWSKSHRITLNTTASGANITGNVYEFPILIRLSSGNFDFSQANVDGSDIRFTKDDGTAITHEIERWDQGNKTAEIWVKMDTVYGDNSTQSFMMYWGNTKASDNSNSAVVFDTANGFQGVWHLSESGKTIVKDATGNHYNGTPSDTAPADVEGTIGYCRAFNGFSNYIKLNGTADSKLNFQENDTYTISAWVYTDTLDNGFHMIAGKGNEQYFLGLKRSIPTDTMRWEFVEYHNKAGWQITQDIPSANAWTYLVGVRKGTTQYLYINEKLVDSTIEVSTSDAPRYTGDDFTIGKFLSVPAYTDEGMCAFSGKIDEVRISNVLRGADWVKLCYMNQKEQNELVKW
jgi:hypothetical protein